ncbi:MAG: tripartite tricarboxylate transporter substrate binding protein [Rubritepida sp.]|nr:tripartite tricarboxylate transporter substrate binding protein [Rubritepida sp.]
MLRRRTLVALPLAGLAVPALAQSAPWPSRGPVRLISTFPPGGFADTMARLLAAELGPRIGQSVVVENRVGAGGTIGAAAAAQAAPDGYTLVMSHSSPFGVAAGTYPNLPYNVVDDFTHLALLAESANLLMVKGDSPLRTLADYIALARRQSVRYGSSGVGSGTHLMGEVLARSANLPNLDHIPYRGSAPALQDLLAGRIESVFDPITTNTQMIREGQVHVLALSTPARIPAFPAIPTFAEQGYPQLTNTTWAGLSAPKGLPPEIAARLTEAAVASMAAPAVAQRLEQLANYAPSSPVTGAAYAAFIRDFATRWGNVARQAGITAS